MSYQHKDNYFITITTSDLSSSIIILLQETDASCISLLIYYLFTSHIKELYTKENTTS